MIDHHIICKSDEDSILGVIDVRNCLISPQASDKTFFSLLILKDDE